MCIALFYLGWQYIIISKICSCDSDEDIEVADEEEINEVEEVEDQADNDSKYIESHTKTPSV